MVEHQTLWVDASTGDTTHSPFPSTAPLPPLALSPSLIGGMVGPAFFHCCKGHYFLSINLTMASVYAFENVPKPSI